MTEAAVQWGLGDLHSSWGTLQGCKPGSAQFIPEIENNFAEFQFSSLERR
jgi:hypothetical protein